MSLCEKYRRQQMYINQFDLGALITAIAETIEEETRPPVRPRSISDLVVDSLKSGPKGARQIIRHVEDVREIQPASVYRTLTRLTASGRIFKSGTQGSYIYSLEKDEDG